MDILWLIYWLSFLIVVSGGLALAYVDRKDLNIKHAVVGFFLFSAVAILPVLNTIAAALAVSFCVSQILDDDDPNRWYNKPLFPKK